MSLSGVSLSRKRVVMFGGKGGVGKTSTSASAALHFAAAGLRTLIISSDLSPSLSDIFEAEVGATETPISAVPNLWALEVNTDEVMRRWKAKFGAQIYEASQVFLNMPYDEIVDYVGMAPGIQEEFLLDFVLDKVRGNEYDMVVWDTAPAGDTLRLLELPHRFLEHLRTAPKVYLRVRDKLQLGSVPFLELIESWRSLSEEVAGFFRDEAMVEFVLVTIPEALGVFQARRTMDDLTKFGLHVKNLLVNFVVDNPDSDFMRRRQAMQQPYLQQLEKDVGGTLCITRIPLFAEEVKGIDRLSQMQRLLFRVQ
ncbi:MAG TPA: ArsA family ATPase [Anaerolineae bacterium]|nr:ArsA family ATPase [Anaerolineae bacterium]